MKRVLIYLFAVVLVSMSFLAPITARAQETIGPNDGSCWRSYVERHWWGSTWFISHCDLETYDSPGFEMVRQTFALATDLEWFTEPFDKYMEFVSSYDEGNGVQVDISWVNGIPIGIRTN
jgi:hypothetical protein